MSTDCASRGEKLTGLVPAHRYWVGIDSDGCVFDTMELKQKACFHSTTIRLWGLEAVEKEAREVLEFVNLYSKWRGQNRFLSQYMVFDLLRARPEVRQAGVRVPELSALKRFVASGQMLTNSALERVVRETGDPELERVLKWSLEVNEVIERTVRNVAPFQWVRESLERMSRESDVVCVSQTPEEALVREWNEHGLLGYVRALAGPELGTKTDHIRLATSGRYGAGRILMVGDAPGDRKAAAENGALFYPIVPRREVESWERFYFEAYDRFVGGRYAGEYEARLVAEFEQLLPEDPPWKR